MEIQFYLRRGSEVSGPIPLAGLQEMAAAKLLSPQDEVSQDQKNWVPASAVNGLIEPSTAATASDRPFDVFISYSSHDRREADVICGTLEARGIRCWIAPRNLLPGTEWAHGILQAIERSRLMVLVFSDSANNSPQVRREVERAVNRELPIIPFRVQNVLPTKALEYCLGNTHWFDAFDPPLEKHVEELADVVRRLLAPGATTGKPTIRAAPKSMGTPSIPPPLASALQNKTHEPKPPRRALLVTAVAFLLFLTVGITYFVIQRQKISPAASDAPLQAPGKIADSKADSDRKILDATLPDLNFDAEELQNVLNYLGTVMGVNIEVKWEALQSLGMLPGTPITIKLHNSTFAGALKDVLAQADDGKNLLTFSVSGKTVTVDRAHP